MDMLRQKTVDAACAKIARRLRVLRQEKGLSMNAVAERAGLSQQMVSYVERGMRKPNVDTLIRLFHALEISPVDFFREN